MSTDTTTSAPVVQPQSQAQALANIAALTAANEATESVGLADLVPTDDAPAPKRKLGVPIGATPKPKPSLKAAKAAARRPGKVVVTKPVAPAAKPKQSTSAPAASKASDLAKQVKERMAKWKPALRYVRKGDGSYEVRCVGTADAMKGIAIADPIVCTKEEKGAVKAEDFVRRLLAHEAAPKRTRNATGTSTVPHTINPKNPASVGQRGLTKDYLALFKGKKPIAYADTVKAFPAQTEKNLKHYWGWMRAHGYIIPA